MTYTQPPGPMERARSVIAAGIEERHPGWTVGHGTYGWRATKAGRRDVRSSTYNGFEGDIRRADEDARSPRAAGRASH